MGISFTGALFPSIIGMASVVIPLFSSYDLGSLPYHSIYTILGISRWSRTSIGMSFFFFGTVLFESWKQDSGFSFCCPSTSSCSKGNTSVKTKTGLYVTRFTDLLTAPFVVTSSELESLASVFLLRPNRLKAPLWCVRLRLKEVLYPFSFYG